MCMTVASVLYLSVNSGMPILGSITNTPVTLGISWPPKQYSLPPISTPEWNTPVQLALSCVCEKAAP